MKVNNHNKYPVHELKIIASETARMQLNMGMKMLQKTENQFR